MSDLISNQITKLQHKLQRQLMAAEETKALIDALRKITQTSVTK
jgi:hypothetical protein